MDELEISSALGMGCSVKFHWWVSQGFDILIAGDQELFRYPGSSIQ